MIHRLQALRDEGQAALYAYRWYIVILGFCALAGYGFTAFNLTLAGDDWQNFLDGTRQYDRVVRLGRWGQRVIYAFTQDIIFAPAFTMLMLVAMLILAGWIFAVVMGLREGSTVFFFVALLIFHPLWSQEVNFKINHLVIGIAMLLAAAAAYVAHRAYLSLLRDRRLWHGLLWVVLSALLMSLSISIKQVYLFFTFGAVVFRVMNDALHQDEYATPLRIIQRIAILLAVTLLGLVLYVVEVDLSQRVSGLTAREGADAYALTESLVSSPADLSFTLNRFAETFWAYYFQDSLLMPLFIKVVYWLAVAALVVYSARQGNPITTVLLVLALIGLLLMPWVIGILRLPENSFRFTAIVPNSLIYAGPIALVLHHLQTRSSRLVLQVLATCVIVVFLHQQNSIALVTHTINQRDYAIANRMLTTLEQDPAYPLLLESNNVRLVTVGILDVSTARPFGHVNYGNTIVDRTVNEFGLLTHQPQKLHNLLQLLQAQDIQFRRHANRYEEMPRTMRATYAPIVEEMNAFPQPGSIRITPEGDLIIMLSRPN